MTTFRCPYCKQALSEPLPPRCPKCDKVLILRKRKQGSDPKDRQRTKERIRKDAERARRQMTKINLPLNTPAYIFLILVVFVVLGALLIGRVRHRSGPRRFRTPQQTAMKEVEVLRMAVELFNKDCRRYPTTEEGLVALVLDPGVNRWSGHYVYFLKPDPWKRPYRYSFTNGAVTLFSSGPDGKAGTADDIRSETPDSNEVYRTWVQWHTGRYP